MKKVYLLTWNQDKVRAAQLVFDEFDIQLELFKPDEPEIQASTSLEIAKHTALSVARKHNICVIREDHALYFNWILWWCFPWPYTSYFDKGVRVDEFLRCLYPHWNEQILDWYFELGCVYAKPDGTSIDLSYRVEIEISKEARWDRGNLDKILMIKWSWKTFAECVPWENMHHWTKNFEKLAKIIQNQ